MSRVGSSRAPISVIESCSKRAVELEPIEHYGDSDCWRRALASHRFIWSHQFSWRWTSCEGAILPDMNSKKVLLEKREVITRDQASQTNNSVCQSTNNLAFLQFQLWKSFLANTLGLVQPDPGQNAKAMTELLLNLSRGLAPPPEAFAFGNNALFTGQNPLIPAQFAINNEAERIPRPSNNAHYDEDEVDVCHEDEEENKASQEEPSLSDLCVPGPSCSASTLSPESSYETSRRRLNNLQRDEDRLRALNISLSVENVVNLSNNHLAELFSNEQLSVEQLQLCKEIRRRGKNKLAAMNCRLRRMARMERLKKDTENLSKALQKRRELREHLLRVKQSWSNINDETKVELTVAMGKEPKEYELKIDKNNESAQQSVFFVKKEST